MRFIGQIGDDAALGYPSSAEGIYYSFYCSDCAVTATNYQQS
jgi:hypothetical protein